MNCDNCGAPMTLLEKQRYFFCEYCGSFKFPHATEDGVIPLGEVDYDIKCPICDTVLTRAAIDDYDGYMCQNCQGVLMEQADFARIVTQRRAKASGSADPPRPLDRAQLDRHLTCPRCGQPMSTHPYYGPGNIVIDTCPRCEVIWLDFGELSSTINAPGPDRGREPKEDIMRLVKVLERRQDMKRRWY